MNSNAHKKILLVEDETITLFEISTSLEDLGYDVAGIVSSGDEAIELMKSSGADLILMDISLDGDKDGIETSLIINEQFNVPIIYITSSSNSEMVERSKKTNPFGYIIKPIDRKELAAGIEMAFLRFAMENSLKDNADKLRAILNSIGDGVIVSDNSGMINYANPVAVKILDRQLSGIVGSHLDDVFKIDNNIVTGGNMASNLSCEGQLVINESERLQVSYSIAPVKNPSDPEGGSVIVFKDDTNRIVAQKKLNVSIEKLSRAVSGIIQAMAYTIETRDPYTAGHQRRVADLAGEIANEMGLSENIVEAVRMSGTIHDLGKIAIPAEILNKPGKLSSIEFELIKTHVQTGYDILKNIDFPWPLASIIYQHHEKLDGSGYPQGLSGGDILPEARIIVVADVVEAMASHRPYRASLGIDFALDEISKCRGTLYDETVVNVCISLFREKGYRMEYETL